MLETVFRKIQSQSRRLKLSIMIALDSAAIGAAYILTLLIGSSGTFHVHADLLITGVGCILAGLCGLYVLQVYRAILSQFGRQSVRRIFWASLLPTIVFYLNISDISLTIIMWLITFILTLGWRDSRNWFLGKNQSQNKKGERVAIYGAGEAGTQAAASFKHYKDYEPICFIDDNKDLHGRINLDLPIYGSDQVQDIVNKHNIDRIILAIPSSSRATRNQILTKLELCNVPIQTLPGMRDILSGNASIDDVRDVDPLDLLGRDPVPADQQLLKKCITGKTVMVSGAGGSIGSEICRQVAELKPKKLVLFEVSEYALYDIGRELEKYAKQCPIVSILGSVQDKPHLSKTIKDHKVQTIYHAAAYKHVPIVEDNVAEAFKNNTLGTLNAAEAAKAAKVEHFVLISTDKAVRPTSAMGVTKRLAEQAIQALSLEKSNKTKFCFVRFGNVLGSSGSVIPLFRQQIMAGGPVTITDPEMIRYFMSIPEAAQLVIQAGAMAKGGDAFTLDMGEPVKIVDMAKRLIRLSGLKPKTDTENGDIEIVYTGLRPGEKLYEELFIDESASEPTDHDRIRLEKETCQPIKELKKQLESISKQINKTPNDKLRNAIFKTQ